MQHLDCRRDTGWECRFHGWQCWVPTSTADIRLPTSSFSQLLDIEGIHNLGRPLQQASPESSESTPSTPLNHPPPTPYTPADTRALPHPRPCLVRLTSYPRGLVSSLSRLWCIGRRVGRVGKSSSSRFDPYTTPLSTMWFVSVPKATNQPISIASSFFCGSSSKKVSCVATRLGDASLLGLFDTYFVLHTSVCARTDAL